MSLRRTLPLALAAVVLFAACSGDDADSIPQISLVPETEPVDLCEEADEDGFEVAATVPDTVDASASTAPSASTTPTDSSDPTASSTPTASSEPADPSTPTDSSQPTDSSTPTNSSQPTDSSTPTDSSQPTDSSEVTETTVDEFADVPDVELPEEIPTELVRTVLEEGPAEGPEAGQGDIVEVYYVGVLSEDGTEFDSNYGSGTPFPTVVGAGTRIPGWDEGIVGVRPGDRIQLDMPSELGYGEAGSAPAIPPDAALTFVMDIVDVIDLPEETPTELEVTVVEEGPSDGPEAEKFDTVNVHSEGILIADGTQFEDTAASGTPRPIVIGEGRAAGLEEALTGAQPGDRLRVVVPSELGYGAAGEQNLGIPPDAALFYELEVVDVVSPPEFELPEEAPEELVRTVLTEGDADGRVAQRFDTVDAHLIGVVLDEEQSVFASTFGTGDPIALTIAEAPSLSGLYDGLRGVRPGDVVQLDIPADQAFGEAGNASPPVPPDTAMTFVVEVDDVTGPPLVDLPEEIPTELTITELEPGTGEPAAEGDTVWVNYTAVLSEDGTRFATNYQEPPYPVTIGAGDVVAGWEDGLVGATTGSRIQIDMPAEEGYQDVGVPSESVPEDAAISFLVDVVAIAPATDEADAPTDLELPLTEEPLTEVVVDDVTVGDGEELTTGLTGYADVYLVCAINGAVIDNSWGAENRVELPMQAGQLMDGLLEGLEGMKVGGRRIISVPADLALGSAGNVELGVGANHDLIFVVDLYAVIDPTPPPPSTEPTASSEPTESTEPTASTEPAETTAAPTASTEPTESTESTESTETTETTDAD